MIIDKLILTRYDLHKGSENKPFNTVTLTDFNVRFKVLCSARVIVFQEDALNFRVLKSVV